MLDISFGLKTEADKVIRAVEQTLKDGFRTRDIADSTTSSDKIIGTDAMGEKIVEKI
jgi:3-isopropylmalate dehydrogenase